MDTNNQDTPKAFNLHFANYFKVTQERNSWGPRTLQDYEMIYMVKGRGDYSEKGKPGLLIQENEVLLIPPLAEHTFACKLQEGVFISCIHFSFHPDMIIPAEVCSTGQDTEILHLFKKCAEEFGAGRQLSGALQDTILAEIWLRLMRSKAISKALPEPDARQAIHR
jgi:hypothetical protein